jgi:hypothetical protein
MAISKLNFNSINVTPSANAAIGFDSGADDLETGSGGGAMKFISKTTASSSSTISITSGIDSTYKEYMFIFNNIHPGTDGTRFTFQGDTGTNTNYNQTITSSFFYAQQGESNDPLLAYGPGQDQAQGTGFQDLSLGIDSDGNDSSCSGYLHIFNPSSSTFVKHFIGDTQLVGNGYYSYGNYSAGYFNTTTAITRFQFKMSSGNIDAGTITLYGIS